MRPIPLRRHRRATLAALAAILPLPAYAQAAGDATLLPPVDVSASPPGSPTRSGVEQQRSELERTAGAVGFVDAESYRGSYSNTLRDVLKDSPGVFVQERYGQELRLSIRGSGLARGFHLRGLEILQDGIPVNLADGSGDFYQIDPLALRSAEVYRGGNALAFGSSYLGGAINFVTPTAFTAIAPDVARIEGGSFGTTRASAQVSRILGDADFLIGASLTHADGYREHEKQRSANVNGNVGYRFGAGAETRFYFGSYTVDQRLPGSLGLSDALERPRMAAAAALAGDQARVVRVERIANRTSFQIGGGRLDLDSWAIHKNLFHPIFQVIDQDGWTWGLAPRYSTGFSLGGLRDELVVGGRWFAGRNEARQYVNVGGSRGALTQDALQQANNLEGYFENRLYVVPALALTAGAKLLHDERRLTNHTSPALGGERTYEGVAPKVGLLWEPRPGIQAFADVTRSLDVPDFSDLAQTQFGGATGLVPLDQQRAWTVEAGTRGSLGPYGWDLTVYRSWVKGQLLQYVTDSSIPAATFNADATVLQGVELAASVRLARGLAAGTDSLTLGGVWTWSDFRFRGDPVYGDNRIAGVPEHVTRATLTYEHPSGLRVAPSVDWVPQGAWADQANTLRVPGYALLGLQLGWDLPNGLFLFLNGRNLTDERYVSDIATITDARVAGTSIFYPGAGRSVYAGLRAAF